MTEAEDFLGSELAVNPAPERDLAKVKVGSEMDEDEVIETRANEQDMNLDASK